MKDKTYREWEKISDTKITEIEKEKNNKTPQTAKNRQIESKSHPDRNRYEGPVFRKISVLSNGLLTTLYTFIYTFSYDYIT